MKIRQPAADELKIVTPAWALQRATEIGAEMARNISALGVRVIGDLPALGQAPASEPQLRADDGPGGPLIPAEVAVRAVAGAFIAGGVASPASAEAPPPEPSRPPQQAPPPPPPDLPRPDPRRAAHRAPRESGRQGPYRGAGAPSPPAGAKGTAAITLGRHYLIFCNSAQLCRSGKALVWGFIRCHGGQIYCAHSRWPGGRRPAPPHDPGRVRTGHDGPAIGTRPVARSETGQGTVSEPGMSSFCWI